MKTITGTFQTSDVTIGIVVGRFNSFITDRLLDAAIETLQQHGVGEDNVTCVKVPGAFEIPVVVKRMAQSGNYDAILALGCVIRGATPHFDYVAGECARGVQQVSVDSGLPVSFGVLTVDTIEQAIERAGSKAGNKGADAALAVLETLDVIRQLGKQS
jgi:6,7-dimethyl-8-ribityllumazine synthase